MTLRFCVAFGPELFKSRVNIVPVDTSVHTISMIWPFGPATPQNKLMSMLSIFSDLLGDEGEGSIISILRERNIATELSAGKPPRLLNPGNLLIDLLKLLHCT